MRFTTTPPSSLLWISRRMVSVSCSPWATCSVRFVYSIQARHLAWNHIGLGPVWTATNFYLHALGYWISRGANGEKNDFRNGKNPKNLQYIETKRGTKLLTSGWWVSSQLFVSASKVWVELVLTYSERVTSSWLSPTGFETPVTYFYFMFFVVLLIHRQMRDDEQYAHK